MSELRGKNNSELVSEILELRSMLKRTMEELDATRALLKVSNDNFDASAKNFEDLHAETMKLRNLTQQTNDREADQRRMNARDFYRKVM